MSDYTDRTCGCELPPESSPNDRTDDTIDLTLGVFFDGTANNKYNFDSKLGETNPGKYKKQDSYYGAYSNVANLWTMYDDEVSLVGKVYVEGIGTYEPKADGTSSGEKDDSDGTAFGMGSTGINAKIARGYSLIIDQIEELKAKANKQASATVETLTLDVFGFSRGAATARRFVSCINGIKGRIVEVSGGTVYIPLSMGLKAYLKYKNISVNNIRVRFLGLFDTVSSYEPGFLVFGGVNFDDDVDQLALSIPSFVQKTIHLVAADEYRANFSLTTIDSAGNRGIEMVLPGAHSDVGGGYGLVEQEPIYMGNYLDPLRSWRGYLSFKELDEGQWIAHPLFTDKHGKFMQTVQNKYNAYWLLNRKPTIDAVRAEVLSTLCRPVLNHYSRIPLAVMQSYAIGTGVVFNENDAGRKTEIKNPYGKLYDEPFAQLKTMKDKVMGLVSQKKGLYIINKESEEVEFVGSSSAKKENDWALTLSLRAVFLHLSARNDKSYLVVTPYKAAAKNKRKFISDGSPLNGKMIIDSPIKGGVRKEGTPDIVSA